jgi:hypothetical protein
MKLKAELKGEALPKQEDKTTTKLSKMWRQPFFAVALLLLVISCCTSVMNMPLHASCKIQW